MDSVDKCILTHVDGDMSIWSFMSLAVDSNAQEVCNFSIKLGCNLHNELFFEGFFNLLRRTKIKKIINIQSNVQRWLSFDYRAMKYAI